MTPLEGPEVPEEKQMKTIFFEASEDGIVIKGAGANVSAMYSHVGSPLTGDEPSRSMILSIEVPFAARCAVSNRDEWTIMNRALLVLS
jgi:hypothetical protein